MKPKSREQIIAEQESIGNVEITEEQYGLIKIGSGEIQISLLDEDIYFAPRDVVYPKEKQDVKDNHSSEIKAHVESKDEEPEQVGLCSRESHSSGSDIQSSKIFEDVIKLIEENRLNNCPMKREKCLPDKFKRNCESCKIHFKLEKLFKSKIKEKWGKIER